MKQITKNVSPMSNEGRNTYVIKHITDSLVMLLKDKSLANISISELCELAGIGRASFYRNFESKEDILRAHINQLFQEWIGVHDGNNDKLLNELIRAIFSHFEDHRDFYMLLSERHLVYLLKDVIIGICGPKPEHSKIAAYSRAFVSYTLYGWIEVWFQRGMLETADEMADMFKSQGL